MKRTADTTLARIRDYLARLNEGVARFEDPADDRAPSAQVAEVMSLAKVANGLEAELEALADLGRKAIAQR